MCDAEGNTALHVAVQHTWIYIEQVTETEHRLVDTLLAASADPAQVNDSGVCALDLAAQVAPIGSSCALAPIVSLLMF